MRSKRNHSRWRRAERKRSFSSAPCAAPAAKKSSRLAWNSASRAASASTASAKRRRPSSSCWGSIVMVSCVRLGRVRCSPPRPALYDPGAEAARHPRRLRSFERRRCLQSALVRPPRVPHEPHPRAAARRRPRLGPEPRHRRPGRARPDRAAHAARDLARALVAGDAPRRTRRGGPARAGAVAATRPAAGVARLAGSDPRAGHRLGRAVRDRPGDRGAARSTRQEEPRGDAARPDGSRRRACWRGSPRA